MTALTEWQNFYVIVGGSAGALIGLQFVVTTLVSEMPLEPGLEQASSAFSTPTIVHFGTVLLLSALLNIPWHTITAAAVTLDILGFIGLVYTVIVARALRVQIVYTPVFEDWLFHAMLPFLAYLLLGASALAIPVHVSEALFGIAGAALMLLFIGIHNSWDSIVYLVFVKRK